MTQRSPEFASVEFYAHEAEAIAALRPQPGERRASGSPLPAWATASEVMEVGGVTRLRPDNAAIRDMEARPGLRYRDLVRHHGRDRLVLDFTALLPFGHPFHDDIFLILHELGRIGGRLAIYGAADWYINRLSLYPIRVLGVPPTTTTDTES